MDVLLVELGDSKEFSVTENDIFSRLEIKNDMNPEAEILVLHFEYEIQACYKYTLVENRKLISFAMIFRDTGYSEHKYYTCSIRVRLKLGITFLHIDYQCHK